MHDRYSEPCRAPAPGDARITAKVRADGTLETDKDLLDWLKYAQSETTGIKLGYSKGELAELDVQFETLWRNQ